MPALFLITIILISILLLYLVISFVVSYFFTKWMVEPYCDVQEDTLQHEFKKRNICFAEFESQFQHFIVTTNEGYHLKATYIPKQNNRFFSDGKERVVILVHGWSSHRYAMLSYAKIYLKLGFHVVLYDHRNHFESDKKVTTMGNKEADDLQCVIEEIIRRLGNNIIIGTHGESMGSATAMIHAGRYHSVDFLVEDCGYSSLKDLLKYQCKELRHFPVYPTIFFSNLFFKLKTGSFYKAVQPKVLLSTCDDIPMLFIHGDEDHFVPSYMVYQNYDGKNGFKMIHVYKHCHHATCHNQYPKQYDKDVEDFLKKAKIVDE